MIGLGTKKQKQNVTGAADVPRTVEDGSTFLYIDKRGKVRKRARPVRIIGNLLIVTGLLMLLGIGGWYGYNEWQNQQFVTQVAANFGPGKVDPPIVADAEATATIAAPTPLPPLNVPSGLRIGGITQVLQARAQEDTSPPVKLSIPSVKIDTKIVPISWKMIPSKGGGEKSEWQVADYAVGHHAGTANPGEPGNVVLSGHVDYRGEVFKNLKDVKKGDEVTVYTEKGQYLYVVTDMVIVKEEGVSEEQKRANAAYMNPTPDQTLTMITCWPYGVDDHRLIVIAKPYQSSASTQSEFVIR